MSVEAALNWIEEELVPCILKDRANLKKVEVHELDGMKDNWASSMYVLNLIIKQKDNDKTVSFLVKVMNAEEKVREKMLSHKQFFNEIHFYSTVMTLFSSRIPTDKLRVNFRNLFPKCRLSYFNNNKKPETYRDAYIVMENLKVLDYKLGDRLYLDFRHLSLALRELGEFHAYSYFAKERNLVSFMDSVVKPIQETNYDSNDQETWNRVFSISEQRVIDSLSKEVSGDDFQLETLKELAKRNPFDVFIKLVTPLEPQSVLCHGDFLRNNILFKYEDERPVHMKLIDFQTIRYASPIIDVSLIMCMNSTHDLRLSHFEELLRVYHDSLKKTLTSLLEISESEVEKKYSFQSFLSEFRARALYGYLISIEFIPWMCAEDDELETFVQVYWDGRGSDRHLELARDLGGEKATQALVDLAKDLIKEKCIPGASQN